MQPRYIERERIPVVPLQLILVDDERLPLGPGEKPVMKSVRFRTLSCYPLTAAIESRAATIADIVEELRATRFSERAGRLIDHDQAGAMEQKKREGYF
jgi:sulfate adenylyltransferase subunit 2